jgi:hypothetical protein
LSFVAFYSYLVSWLVMIWACAYYTDFTDGWFLWELLPFSCLFDYTSIRTSCVRSYKQTWKGLKLSQKSTIREIDIICACSDHGQPRYQIWIKSNKRQMTHFIHIWYLDWPWSEHAHIIPISRMVDFCESYSPFHVPLRAAAINSVKSV